MTSEPTEFWLTGLQFADGRHADLLVKDGRIARIGSAGGDVASW